MPAYIVVVEDDFLQEGPLAEYLAATFPTARIDTITTESTFRERIPGFRDVKPDVVILDLMLRWEVPSPTMTPQPPDVAEGGYLRAGLRCAELLANDDFLSTVPVIVYTILERGDLESSRDALRDVDAYLRKSADLEMLARKIRDLVPSHRLAS
jgi:DNA-binding NarL/FixJ family response regulator